MKAITDMTLSELASDRREADATAYRLAAIVESSEDAIIGAEIDGAITSWNRGAERMLGYTAEEMVGRPLSSIWPDGLLGHFEAVHARLLNGEAIPTWESECVHKDGTIVHVSATMSPVKESAGRTVGVASILRDITEQREAQTAVALLASVAESSEDAIIASRIDGAITAWNPGAQRLFGYTAAEILGEPISRLWPPEDLASYMALQDRLLVGERVPAVEIRARRKDGTTTEVSIGAFALKDVHGLVTGVSAIARDISDRKRAERELLEARRRFEGAFENAPSGMALVDTHGRWLVVNRSLCRLMGRDETDLLATDFQSLTHPEDLDSNLDQLRRSLAGEITEFECEKRYLRPGGEVVWVAQSVSLIRDEAGEALHFVAQMHDISARKESEQELRLYSEQLTEMALQDPLTGLRNYRDFHAMLDSELERSRRHPTEWSLVLFDVDRFQEINAAQGHEAGDRVLREVGSAIAQARRSYDLAARIGSDEFALILPGTSPADAHRTAKRIAAETAERSEGLSLTFGVASYPADGRSKELMLLRADMQLQAAKTAPGALAHTGAAETAPAPSGAIEDIQRILTLAREQMDMEVAYVAELTETSQTFRAFDGDVASFGAKQGATLPTDATYCHRMLEGKVPNAIPDTAAEPGVADLHITAQAGIGAYVGVPLELADGRLYGTLCVLSHDPRPDLSERDVELMRFLAGLISDQIEHDHQESSARRSQAELAGIGVLLSALLARDHYTGEHSKTVVELAIQVGRRLDLSEERVLEVEQVALLHDIGKVGVPDSVLQKRGPLTDQEWELMRQHPAIGARILSGTETLAHLASAVKAEHERFDGNGYPDGLRGEEIPLASRICFACDSYHAMTSDRPYRASLTHEQAIDELGAGAGSQFDPTVVEALLAVVELDSNGARLAFDLPSTAGPHPQPASFMSNANVLDSGVPRQIPAWEPSGGTGSAAALGHTRAVCRQCGCHVSAVVTRAATSGRCGNCGSFDLDLLETHSNEAARERSPTR